MTTSTKSLYAIAASFMLLAVAALMFGLSAATPAHADSFVGDYSTTTDSSFASATATRQLKNGSSSVLGNVIMTATSSATAYPQIVLYDASSTMATTSAKVLAKFGGSNQQLGTYQFDAAAAYGVKLEVAPGYNGNATITWR